jgi:hypothetical protein
MQGERGGVSLLFVKEYRGAHAPARQEWVADD